MTTSVLPERILQFGTGVFLRGFVADYVQQANESERYKGSIVVVKSTNRGDSAGLERHGLRYHLQKQGLVDGQPQVYTSTISCWSRILAAQTQWAAVLEVACRPELEAIVSNTTEAGLLDDSQEILSDQAPASFPGKVAALLYARFMGLGVLAPVLTMLPCELVERNARMLKASVLALASTNGWPPAFAQWLDTHVRWCDTLVDRIVSGLAAQDGQEMETVVAETFGLWAIEADTDLAAKLPFLAHPDIKLMADIEPMREVKVRILNGLHTFIAPLAYLEGHTLVREAMASDRLAPLIRRLALEQIVPTVPAEDQAKDAFAQDCLARFANPYSDHKLIGICLQQTTKFVSRCLPTLHRYHAQHGRLSAEIETCIMAMILFFRPLASDQLPPYPIADDKAPLWQAHWEQLSTGQMPDQEWIDKLLANKELWGALGFPPGTLQGWPGERIGA